MGSTSITHGINKHHPWDQQASSMGSTSIIDNIASLIATFKRYALVHSFFHSFSTLAQFIANFKTFRLV